MFDVSANLTASTTLQSAVRRYFEVALYLLVLTGFGTLASTGGLDFPTVVVVALVLFVRGYLLAKRRSVVIPETWTTYLTLIYVAFYLADYFLVSGSFIGATVHLVLFGVLVRLYSLRRERDHYTLAILAFLMVLAASVLTVDSTFLLLFACFVLVAIATFMLMEMRHTGNAEVVQAREQGPSDRNRRMGLSVMGIAPVVMVAVLLGASVIFFLLPRASLRFLTSYAMADQVMTGFSDRVQLGTIGQIQQSQSVVMHIRIDGDTRGTHDLKWRGVSLSLFDGRVWSNPFEQAVAQPVRNGVYVVATGDEPVPLRGPRHLVHYRVMMEPIGSNVFFLAPRPRVLEGRYRTLAVDAGGAVFNLDSERPITIYDGESDIATPPLQMLRAADTAIPSRLAMAYLQLPALDIRIPQLAQEITADEQNSFDKATAIERYLQTNFGYTLQLPSSVPRDPLANFLFERKRGHCEYFASAMAVMLRTLNIPSRVVNGFRTTEFNDLTGNYVIRASSAHSWVEAYFPGQGWVSFDPTPAAIAAPRTTWNRFLLYLDAASSFWREWVVNYDATHQRTLGKQALRGGREMAVGVHDWGARSYQRLLASARSIRRQMSAAPWRWVLGAALASMMLVLVANGPKLWSRLAAKWIRSRPQRAPQEAAALWYEHMTRLMAKRGWRKSPFDTPAAFVEQIDNAELRRRVKAFTQSYESARFGFSIDDARELPQLYATIREVLENERSSPRSA